MGIGDYKRGLFSGIIFGLFSLLVGIFGLFSYVAEIVALGLMGLLFRGILMNLISAIIINMVFYAFIGFLIQYFLKKGGKNEKIVSYVFIVVAVLIILTIIIEAIIRGGLTP